MTNTRRKHIFKFYICIDGVVAVSGGKMWKTVNKKRALFLSLVITVGTFFFYHTFNPLSDKISFFTFLGASEEFLASLTLETCKDNKIDIANTTETERQFKINSDLALGGRNKKAVILMWTHFHSQKGDSLRKLIYSGRKWNRLCCLGSEVVVTLDKCQLDKADAVVIHSRNFHLPPWRKPGQIWILFAYESPVHTPNLTKYNDVFNWTMSYRRDSDIWAPYGEYCETGGVIKEDEIKMGNDFQNLSESINGKTQLLAGVMSYCSPNSKREIIVDALRQAQLPVHIYGACGDGDLKICERDSTSCDESIFWTQLAKKFKFFFAAENSLCEDYVTEKFWRTLELGMVPVVYGGANYSELAPPNSFIDVRDFQSAEQLAKYLLYLDNNQNEYRRYFQWRQRFTVVTSEMWLGWCDLCNKIVAFNGLDATQKLSYQKSYNNVERWWHCVQTRKGTEREMREACLQPLVLE